jgi:hypothetical protein
MSLWSRVFNFLCEEDKALNELGGGRRGMTLSGTVGREANKGKWWAIHIAAPILDFLFGKDHCKNAAINESNL